MTMKRIRQKATGLIRSIKKYLPGIQRPQGNTLLYIVLVMVIFGMLGATMVSLFTASTVSTATLNEERRARYLYESAGRYAMSELRNNNFESSRINDLNATTHTLSQGGTFDLNIYSLWFRSTVTVNLPAGDPLLRLDTEEGEIPDEVINAIPAGNIYVVNMESTEVDSAGDLVIPANNPNSTAVMNGIIKDTATEYRIGITEPSDNTFSVNQNDRVLLAVHPTATQNLNAGDDLEIHEDARFIFPKNNGLVYVKSQPVSYERAVHIPGARVELTNISEDVTISSTEFVVLLPNNHYIIPTATAENVTYNGDPVDILSVADTGDLTLGKYGDPRPDITMPELADNITENETDSDFVTTDTTSGQEKIAIGDGTGDRFGGAWYDDDKSVGGVTNFCTDGNCIMGRGVRVYFTFEKIGGGNGFIFSLINGSSNTKDSIGGDIQAVELLGYAGDSREVVVPAGNSDYLDNQGVGLEAPKIGLEFDAIVNFDGGQSFCLSGTNIKTDTRHDPLTNNKDGIQYVFWGRNDSVPIPCRNNNVTYDDNRHNPASGIGLKQWDGFLNGFPSLGQPAIGPNGNIYISNRTDITGYFVTAYEQDGTKAWDFPVVDQPLYNPGVDPISGVIYSDIAGNLIVAINPDGSEKWNLDIEADIPSSPIVGSDGTVYVGGNQSSLPGTNGSVYAITDNGNSGSINWRYHTVGSNVTTPALSMDESVVYAAGGTPDSNLYAINTSTGTADWIYSAPDAINGGPTVDPIDGTIYFGCNNNRVYAINPDGSFKWISGAITVHDVLSAPAVDPANGTVYATSNDLGNSNDDRLYAFDRANGSLKWQFITGNEIRSAPVVGADGTVYFGSDNNNLYAIDPDGNELWTFNEPTDDVKSTPVIGIDERIYFGADDSKLYAIDPLTEIRNYWQNIPTSDLPEEKNNLVAYFSPEDPSIANNPYPTGFLPTSENNWFLSGPFAVRMDMSRVTQGDGSGDYELRTWIYQCGTNDCADIRGTFFENTRVDYEPSNIPPQLVQTFNLGNTLNTDFNTFLFGFTSAAESGNDQIINIRDFQLSFIRPTDAVRTDPFTP